MSNINYLEDFDFTDDGILLPSKNDPDKNFIIMIFGHWCGHCVKTLPEYKKFSESPPPDTVVAAINCSGKDYPDDKIRQSEIVLSKRIKDLIKNFTGFPTIVKYKNGEYVKTYSGDRTCESFKNFK